MLVEFASRAYRHDELGNAQRARQLRMFPCLPAPLKACLELALHLHCMLFSRNVPTPSHDSSVGSAFQYPQRRSDGTLGWSVRQAKNQGAIVQQSSTFMGYIMEDRQKEHMHLSCKVRPQSHPTD